MAAFWPFADTALGKYRLYQYMIRPYQTEPAELPRRPYQAISTLDPVSYQSYHGGGDIQEINLLRSWMCMGHTGGKEFCPAPLDTMPPGPLNPAPGTPPQNPPPVPLSGPS